MYKKKIIISDLIKSNVTFLLKLAKLLNITNYCFLRKYEIILEIIRKKKKMKYKILCNGVLEILPDGFGFLRIECFNYLASSYDTYISLYQIRKYNLYNGDSIIGKISIPDKKNKFFNLLNILKINNKKFFLNKFRTLFSDLIPLHSKKLLKLEGSLNIIENNTARIIDLISPLGKGQRGLIVAPPKSGKSILLSNIANCVNKNNPEVIILILLIDERPEEVTEMKKAVKSKIFFSTFDESPGRHIQIAEMVLFNAKRLVEEKHDVIILLDSITRLARAYNNISPNSGKILTGGIDSQALLRPKKFFGSARNIKKNGSLSIIATTLIETGSKMDELIYEEFKGTGNMEIYLERNLSEKRIFPSINLNKSGTRREEFLINKKKLKKIWSLRRIISDMDEVESIKYLLKNIKKTKNNNIFLKKIKKKKKK